MQNFQSATQQKVTAKHTSPAVCKLEKAREIGKLGKIGKIERLFGSISPDLATCFFFFFFLINRFNNGSLMIFNNPAADDMRSHIGRYIVASDTKHSEQPCH